MLLNTYKNHPIGQCWYSQSHKNMYIPIPKNASTYFENSFEKTNLYKNIVYNKYVEYNQLTVILRDPIERWVSGITTYLRNQLGIVNEETDKKLMNILKKNQFLINMIVDQIRFDEHTERQTFFIEPFNLNDAYFFLLDNQIETKVYNFYKRQNINLEFDNRYLNSKNNNDISLFFEEYIKTNKSVSKNLNNFYELDFKFMDTVNWV